MKKNSKFGENIIMRRAILIILSLGIIVLGITSCSKDKENGTYYPNTFEMQKNLEKFGYEVLVENNADDDYIGTHLYATKNNEYIEFYWLDDSKFVDKIYEKLEIKYSNYEKIVSIKDDVNFGTLIFCGTELAIDDSGIKIVDVKIKIK